MSQGWVKLHRQITEWEWYRDHNTLILFIHLLLTANHKDGNWQGKEIKRGEKITSLAHLSEETGLSVRNIRTSLKHLISTSEVTKSTTAKYTLLKLKNYDNYQESDKVSDKQATSKRQGSDNKQECKTVKNEKKLIVKENNLDFISPEYLVIVEEWLQYKKEIKDSYKSDMSIGKFYKQLLKLSDNDPSIARDIVDYSIGNGYKGVFAPKGGKSSKGIDVNKLPDWKKVQLLETQKQLQDADEMIAESMKFVN